MNYSAVKYILSYVLMIEGALLLFPFIVGVLYMEQKSVWYLLVAVICIVLGVLGTRHKPKNAMFYFKEGCLATAASWITLSIFGSLPLILTGEYPSYVDALFEIVSGFTTTGATVLSDVECLCHATLFWRAFTHWIGGMGVLVFLLMIIPMSGGSNMNLMRAESPGPSVGKLVPHLKSTAQILYVIYFGNQNASRQIFICAATHAREYMTAQLVMKQLEYYCAHYEDGSYNGTAYRDIFENTCFVIVPMVNPDGVSISQFGEEGLNREDLRQNLRAIYESDKNGGYTDEAYDTYLTRWKANGMGVDLNRNYSPGWESVTDRTAPSSGLYKGTQPGSEAESQALMNIVDGLSNPLLAISYHSYGSLVYWQYGQAEPLWSKNQQLAAHVEALTTYYQAGYSNEAGFSNWCVNVKGIPSVTIETGLVPTPLPLDQFELLWSQNKEMWAMLGTTY